VLVVDDDPSIHRLVSDFLDARGYGVATAATVDDAIAVLRRAPVDAVILDVRMTPGSGLDVLKHVRRTASLQNLPVLLLTGAAFAPEEEEVISAHRAYIFYKQEEDLDELAAYLDRLTSNRKSVPHPGN
jgi:DNA-binding response OmpR family regulator